MKFTTVLALLPFIGTLIGASVAAVQQFYDLKQRVGVVEYWQRYYGVSQPVSADERWRMDEEEWRGHTRGSQSR